MTGTMRWRCETLHAKKFLTLLIRYFYIDDDDYNKRQNRQIDNL